MCGAHIMPYSWREIFEHYSGFIESFPDPRLNIPPHYNLRPTLSSPIVSQKEGTPRVALARWGLVPIWWKEEKAPASTFNAKRESIDEQLAGKRGFWGPAMKTRRCLVVTGGFYEWTVGETKKDKLPWYIHMPERKIFSFAGLSSYHSVFGPSYTIITAPPSENIKHLHSRMPVVMKPENYAAWLSADTAPEEAFALLDDHGDGGLVYHRVEKELVNKQVNTAQCLEEIAA